MRSTAHHDLSGTVYVHRSRMRAYVQIVGGVLLGLGLAAAVDLDPGLLFAAYTAGTGLMLLCLGLLLPGDPDAPANPHDRSRPPHC
jgi:sulfite exporter TauE/SafE